jgi:hypothetical protein
MNEDPEELGHGHIESSRIEALAGFGCRPPTSRMSRRSTRRGFASPASVTVIAPDCAGADAWAAALMVAGFEAGAILTARHGLDALFFLRDDERDVQTRGIGRLFSHQTAATARAIGD